MSGGLPTAFLSWGRQNHALDPVLDKREIQYTLCYPGFNDVPGKMIASQQGAEDARIPPGRRQVPGQHSRRTKSHHCGHGRLAALSGGPRPDAAAGQYEAPLGVDKIRVGPTGKLTLEDTKTSVNALSPEVCDGDRAYLAGIDNDKFLRDVIDDANRGNSTFYMIDPAGLTVKRPADRTGAMRTLAEDTDGLAILNTNDLTKGIAPHARRHVVVLPPRLQREQHQARRPLSEHHRSSEAAGRRGAGEERVSCAEPQRCHHAAGRDRRQPAAVGRRRCRRRSTNSRGSGRPPVSRRRHRSARADSPAVGHG